MRTGDTVDVDNNPLSHAAVNSHIPTLRSRGVTVNSDHIEVSSKTVNIPDSNLRKAIEQALDKARGATITVSDMQTLAALYATSQNITNLTGLEAAINLTELGLVDNNITDISPLAGLTKLKLLDLGENFISNISALTGLVSLSKLWIHNNSISDLSPLVANTGLRSGDTVDVNNNPLNHAAINTHIPTLQSRGVTVEFDQIVAPPQNVNIPDPNLRTAIEQALGKARGAIITPEEMSTLGALYAPKKNIRSLTGLEHATNLTELELDDNSISNISPLARLTNLTVLRLDDNSISDISPLAGLTKLRELYLANNSISDLWPLVTNRGLSSGDKLNLKGNPLSDISIDSYIPTIQSRAVNVEYETSVNIPDPNLRDAIRRALGEARGARIRLEDMARLTELEVTRKTITNLTGLELATNLTRLVLRSNSIADISLLAGLTQLRYLHLGSNIVSNISPLAGLTQLKQLYLEKNGLSDISPLAGLSNLTILELEHNNIRDISPLARLTNLKELGLHNNSISDLSPLVANTGLSSGDKLNVRGNPLNDYSFNTHIIALQSRGVNVNSDHTQVSSETVNILDPNLRKAIEQVLDKARGATITVSDMQALAALDATSEYITNLTGLEAAINLRELRLVDNNITDISPLTRLTKLRLLDLGENSISNISALTGLVNLSKLWIDNNFISDISPLVANTGLRSGDTVDVDSNPLNHAAVNTHIPTLQSRGVTVELQTITAQQNGVNIPDPNLRTAIEQALGKARGATVTPKEMSTLDALYAPKKNIRSLTGLEHATNLTELGLDDNSISNTLPIARLTNLTALNLAINSISDISPLAGLTNLTVLRLDNNSISDVSPLAGLTQLRELYLQNNSISDLWPLVTNRGLSSGDKLNLKGNPLSDISFDSYIPLLQSRAVTVERDLPGLVGHIPDPNLRHAIRKALRKARDDPLRLEDMPQLTELEVTRKTVTNLTGLELATNLTRLVLRSNGIPDISPLAGLTQLIYLHLGSNRISNISSLAGLTQLRQLYLEKNSFSDISPLAGLTNLTILELGYNKIWDISPLARLTNLTILELGYNKIRDISPLARLANLKELGLRNNFISNILPLERLTKLTELYLQSNSISDLSPLVANTGLSSGDKLNVRGNPLNDHSFNTHIAALQNRGVNVNSDHIEPSSETVNIPDPNLRRVIEQIRGKAQGGIITVIDMQTLAALYAPNKNIRNLTGLEAAINLRELRLVDNNITDISSLAKLTELRQLWLDNNSISDISPLAGLTNLSELRLSNNAISDLSPLVANTGLGSADWIDVRGNPLNNTSINSHIPTLKNRGIVLEFEDPIVTPEPVNIRDSNLRNAIEQALGKARGATITEVDMSTLGALYAPKKNIRNLTGLEHATNLTELGLDDNFISDISPLAGLTDLTKLFLRNNIISDISPVVRLTNLTQLFLQDNLISDISPLVANTGLGSGDVASVSANPLNPQSINTHIPTLQRRGVNISYSDPKPTTSEYTLSIPAGISLIHVPLRVTEVNGVAQTIESISELYDVLGGAGTVNFLITYDPAAQGWLSYFGTADTDTSADKVLTDDTGILAGMATPVTVRLGGDALGTDGSSTINLNQGKNLVGLPLRDSRVKRVSDLFALDGIAGNVPVIVLIAGGEFQAVGRAGDPGDIPIIGGQSFILTAQRTATVTISGEEWTTSERAVAPPVTLKGVKVGAATPILG